MREIFLFSILFVTTVSKAQDEAPGLRSFGIQSGFSVSFSGYSVSLAAVYKLAYHDFFLGPTLSVSNSYLPGKGPWGINTGWRYTYANHKSVGAFILVDYRNSFYRPYDPYNLRPQIYNSIHEINLALGFKWQFVPEWYFKAAIGTGIYYEKSHDIVGNRLVAHSGYSDLLKATFMKQFNK